MTDDVIREIKKLIKGYYDDPDVEPMKFDFPPLDVGARHYGVWHSERGEWWEANGLLFSTTNRAIALAQLSVARQLSLETRWEIRCIEEWVDEQ